MPNINKMNLKDFAPTKDRRVKLNPQQKKDLDELKLNNGFMILVESFERSIKENNVKLANWDFDSYIDKTKNGQDEFIKIQ